MKSYGIPRKILRVVGDIYEGCECAVIDHGEASNRFKLKSGVKQGCAMSAFLFLLVVNWVMWRTKADKRR